MTANDSLKTVLSDGTFTDTQAAVDYVIAKDEDDWVLTIGVAGGTYAWTSAVVILAAIMPRNFTMQGASPSNRPNITLTTPIQIKYTPGKVITVKDLIFTKGDRDNIMFFVQGSGPTPGFRFTNIKWVGVWTAPTVNVGEYFGSSDAEGPYGLVDNCEVDGYAGFFMFSNKSYPARDGMKPLSWSRPMNFGTAKASIVFEDCYFHTPGTYSQGAPLTDTWQGGSFIMRYCVLENQFVANHGSDHFGNHTASAKKMEFMHNTVRLKGAASVTPWMVYFRGGSGVIFDNIFEADAGASASTGIYWDYYRANSGSGPSNSIFDRFYKPLNTTITAGSNGLSLPQHTINVADTIAFMDNPTILVGPVYTNVASGSNGAVLPQGTINVLDTSDFPSSGTLRIGTPNQVGVYGDYAQVAYTGKTSTSFTGCTGGSRTLATGETVAGVGVGEESKWAIYIENIKVTTSAGVQTINATGKTATTFTGCVGGTGVMSTGAALTRASDYLGTQQPGCGTITALVAAGSNGATLPQATINVGSTIEFPATGSLLVNYDPVTGVGTEVAYTGKTATTFTGCTGGTGTLATGQLIGGKGQDPRWPNEIWGRMPVWQWHNRAITAGYGTPLTGSSVHDFVEDDRDIYKWDTVTSQPTNTGTWLDSYTELAYPHPLNDGGAPPTPTGDLTIGGSGQSLLIGGSGPLLIIG